MQLQFQGHCPLCNNISTFIKEADGPFRSLKCDSCKSAPRNRALWIALNNAFPKWKNFYIHEGSPGWDPVTKLLLDGCPKYIASQYVPGLQPGTIVEAPKMLCRKYIVQNLEDQTFADESFDLVITQDVFEHIFDPMRAIKEIARTLKPGGATIMSVPVVRKFQPSRRRANLVDGEIVYILPAEYHGNPVSGDGSLVTIDWGYDIAGRLAAASGLNFIIQTFENMDYGIRDECNQILVGFKRDLSPL